MIESTREDLDDDTLPDLHGQCISVENYGFDGLPGREDMLHFWEDARPWLIRRGIHLYPTSNEGENNVRDYVWVTHPPTTETLARLPYAFCCPPESKTLQRKWQLRKLGMAEDSDHRGLMIKLVEPGSHHYRIFRCLLEDKAFSDPVTFPCVIPPLAILDTPYKYSFVVMPMWGEHGSNTILTMNRVRDVLYFMDCMLQGLVFLHQRRIAHRDIHEVNMMVNYYRYDRDFSAHNEDLHARRRSNNVHYALMDFDQSIILPSDTCLKNCRRPASESRNGSCAYKPWDTDLGEPYYNPFAYDVGMMGNVFRWHLAEVAPKVPACAALFDKMTTWRVAERFTAEEALQFLRDTTAGLDDTSLDAYVELALSEYADSYWDKLSPDMLDKLSSFRTPPVTWASNVLEWFLQFRITRIPILALRSLFGI